MIEPPASSWSALALAADEDAKQERRVLAERSAEVRELALEQFLELGLDPTFAEFSARRIEVDLHRDQVGSDETDRRLDELAAEYEVVTGVAWEVAEQHPQHPPNLLRDDEAADRSVKASTGDLE